MDLVVVFCPKCAEELYYFGKNKIFQHKENNPRHSDSNRHSLPSTEPRFLERTLSNSSGKSGMNERRAYQGCVVEQLLGRAVIDPAFRLETYVQDPGSRVHLQYIVGTSPGSSNIRGWTDMSGSTHVSTDKLVSGHQLYWTVRAENDNGVKIYAKCGLPTYDTTNPGGRIEPLYPVTSHPEKISGTIAVFDDSALQDKQYKSLSLGKAGIGKTVITWEPFSMSSTSYNHEASGALRNFSMPRSGRLTVGALKSVNVYNDEQCATECLKYGTKCISFDFAYTDYICMLHSVVEGQSAKLRSDGSYHNFERLGVGFISMIEYDKLPLIHGTVYYIQTLITNVLDYNAILSSLGTMVDFTPPNPGPIGNASMDVIQADGCQAAVTQQCVDPTWKDNHR